MLTLERTKNTLDAIRNRVSIRRYTDEPVSHEEILDVLELAGHAPSAFNLQPWRFVVVEDAETKGRLREAAMGQAQVSEAPVVIALVTDMEDTMARLEEVVHPGLPEDRRAGTLEMLQGIFGGMTVEERAAWGRNQGNIALGYLLIALESLGFGSSPMLGFDADKVREVLNLPAHAEIPALVSFGRPADGGFPKHRHSVERITQFVN